MKFADPADRLIVALDVETKGKALRLGEALAGKVGALKVGFELFSLAGPSFIHELTQMGHKVFLDLKFHDIPNTVARASKIVTSLGVFMFNVHACGGSKMMSMAAKAVRDKSTMLGLEKPLLIAVTVLTSMNASDLSGVGISSDPKETALRLAWLAKQAGLDGVVASAHEAADIKAECGKDFVVVTPGIRPSGAAAQDQKRIMTPAQAVQAGSDFLVIGRPIHGAPDPAEAAKAIVDEIAAIS